MRSRTMGRIAVLMAGMVLGIWVAASHAADLKERFRQRVPAIAELKQKGVIGENSQGFLSFVGSSREGAGIVSAENADRQTLYESIAAKQGTTAAHVGRRSAIKFREMAKPGEWYQNDGGKWVRK